MRRIFAALLMLCFCMSAALAEPCIAKDGTCPQVVAPTRVFLPAEGESAGSIADSIRPVVSKESMLPWKGALIVGTLPKDAEIVESTQDEFGYAQTLRYGDAALITTARFGSVEARDAYVLDACPVADVYEIVDDTAALTGANKLHIRYACGEKVVDAYYFSDAENFYLFMTRIDAQAYHGEAAYAGFVPVWVDSLEIFKG